jgi:hypothetical protein
MKTTAILAASLAALALPGVVQRVHADSADAMCEVRKDGETKKRASGPCTFSQRQGYIDLDLRNGDTHSLAPGKNANHYKDQKGNKVIRTQSGGNIQEFKWEGGTRIIVTFTTSASAGNTPQPSYRSGDTAPDLADLVGAKGGQAEGELERRGYVYTRGSTSGDAKYGSWYNPSTGRCVMIRTADGRYQSIVQAPPSDCGR